MAGGTFGAGCTGAGSGFNKVEVNSSGIEVTGAGELIIKEPATSPTREFECKLVDEGTVLNPSGGGAGKGTFTFTTFGCSLRSGTCAETEVIATDMPWNTLLVAGPPITDKISGIELEVYCNHHTLENTLSGSLKPEVVHSKPSLLKFTSATGLLGGTSNNAEVIGEDSIEGPGREVVFAE
ncbi:MAG TPA: hypothetical protein VNV42_12600 [Solirubrobacteraceae bacterium]|nr:hypothetical protein [Solirubrobacteraceae bacterium]